MVRYLFGMVFGFVTLLFVVAALSVFFPKGPTNGPIVVSEQSVESAPAVAPVAAPEVEPIDIPEVVQTAHAAFNEDLFKAVAPSLPTPKVTDAQAVRAAALANALRASTGAVPEPQSDDPDVIKIVGALPSSGNAMRGVREGYFEIWDDLMQRCYATVAGQAPLDESGLTTKGDEIINYNEAYSEQTWFSADKAFSIKIKTRSSRSSTGLLRTCILKSNRFALVNSNAVSKLKGRFHDWWAKERFVQQTEDLEYPYKLSPSHKWYGGMTKFGSQQGCQIKVEFSEMSIGRETDATLFLTESDKTGCEAGSGTGTGPGAKVRTNRLPQAGD